MINELTATDEKLVQSHLLHYFATLADDILQTDELFVTKSSVGLPYHNAVNFLSDDIDATKLAHYRQQIEQFYAKHGVNYYCIWDYSYNSIKHIMPSDYNADPTFKGLHHELDAQLFPLDTDTDINYKVVESLSELDDFFEPFNVGFGFDDKVGKNFKSYYQKMLGDSNMTHYVAYHQNKAIASASLYISDETAGLYNLAVLPDYRQQGIAKHLLKLRLNHAKQRNIFKTLIQAVPATEAMTKQIGFQACTDITPIVYQG